MGASETTPLLPVEVTPNESSERFHHARASSQTLSNLFLALQALILIFYIFGTTYPDKKYQVKEYIAVRPRALWPIDSVRPS
jgi:hypothetical protein